ncbi:unnamed protein product [Urochloa decumbens]|uniref:Uncharacterized protein n=1 Tax=Urochloa decumbens TaxID=240449 RepID=A0ABC9C674_9POAL
MEREHEPALAAPALQQQKHLCLVVDDWERGYSIRKVVEDADYAGGLDAPPLVRIEAQHGYSWSLAAHGSKIFAMCPWESSPGIPVFDTETLGVTVCPYPQSRNSVRYYKPVYASASDRLVAFAFPYLDVLGPQPPPGADAAKQPWSWASVEPLAPFASSLVSGYALHPDGRTVFMSVKGWKPNSNGTGSILGQRNSTFAFDTESLEWSYLGEWLLPFKGVGHACCCDVPAPAAAGCQTTMPAWKLGKDLLFDVESRTHVGATLVYMGDSRFCLVKCRKADDPTDRSLRVVNMASFELKYDKEGELRTAKHRAYGSVSYQIAHECVDLTTNPVAFWM